MSYYYESRFAKFGELVQVQDWCVGVCEEYVSQIVKVISANEETGFCKVKASDTTLFYLFAHEYKVQSKNTSEEGEEGEEGETVTMCNSCGCVLQEGEDYIRHREHGLLCEECFNDEFFYCESCDTFRERGEEVETASGKVICESCYENNYFTCGDCSEVYSYDDRTEVNDCYYCPSCAENHNDEVIGDYHHTEVTKYFSRIGEYTEKYIGLELEVEEHRGDKQEAAANVLDLLGRDFIECKYDGSLSNGFEVVTQPASYAYHLEQDYENALEGLRSDGMRSHDPKTCGLHFHVSKAFFVDSESGSAYENIAKMLVMINYIWDDIVKFSRRNYNELDEWAKKTKIPLKENPDFIYETIESNSYDRYQALNIKNRATVEFRFFRGTLRAKTFRASMEWVHLFTDYAVSHSLEECFFARWNDIFCNASENFKEYALSQKIGVAEYDHDRND